MVDQKEFEFMEGGPRTIAQGWLGLTVSYGERIFIGEDIEVMLKERRGAGASRILIKAPKEVRIVRESAINKED